MNTEIAIRSIQHYMYCPHRWGLIEIDRAWAENIYVTKANLMHERVHDPDNSYTLRGKKVYTSVPVYNDKEEYNLYGVTDCLEVSKNEAAEDIRGSDICIVEYKPTMSKEKLFREEDAMQIFAQKICVDYVFKTDSRAAIYYADTKKRIQLDFRESFEKYDSELKRLLSEMRLNLRNGTIPAIVKGQKCSGCSMKDLCMPKIKKFKGVAASIREIDEVCER